MVRCPRPHCGGWLIESIDGKSLLGVELYCILCGRKPPEKQDKRKSEEITGWSRAEFATAKGKRPLREVVADELVVGDFEGWQFTTSTGQEINLLNRFSDAKEVNGCRTWEELRASIASVGWPCSWYSYGQPGGSIGRWVESIGGRRASDGSQWDFSVNNVVVWKKSPT